MMRTTLFYNNDDVFILKKSLYFSEFVMYNACDLMKRFSVTDSRYRSNDRRRSREENENTLLLLFLFLSFFLSFRGGDQPTDEAETGADARSNDVVRIRKKERKK